MLGGRGEPVRIASTALSVDVKPRPDGAGEGWFLPARNVDLVEQWEIASPVFRVGEPVERSVAIRASGLSGAQLPGLELPPIEGMKQYSEPAIDETASVGDEVVSIKLQKAALVPTQAGMVTLPAIELVWWDTEHDESRTAILPARTVEVLPAVGDAAATPPGGPRSPDPGASTPASVAERVSADGLDPLMRWSAYGGLALFGAALIIWALRRQRAARTPGAGSALADSSVVPAASVKGSERRLRAACKTGDPGAALVALREIGRIRWPLTAPAGASGWGARIGSQPLEEAIVGAERARYAAGAAGWTGEALWQCYRAAATERSERRAASAVLPDLYPTP
jgi:hypothetical protein